MTTSIEQKVQHLIDRAEIQDVIYRYCYGMDSRNWDLFRSAWVDGEVTFEANDLSFTSAEVRSYHIDHWVDAVKAFFKNMPSSQHLKIPLHFAINDDSAQVVCLMQGKHFMPNDRGESIQTVVGYYLIDYVRTPAGWRMRGTREMIHWQEGNQYVIDANGEHMAAVLNKPR